MTSSDAEYEFDVECPICGTRQDATSGQIGQRIACPDCHSQVLVPEPPLRARRSRGVPLPAADEELRLSEPVASDPRRALARGMLDSAAEESAPNRPSAGPVEALARETLQRATAEFETEEGDRPPLPARPLTTGIVGILFEPGVLLRCLALAIALHVEVGFIGSAVALFSGNPLQQFLCAMLCVGSIIMGAAVLLTGSVMLLAILQDSAMGKDVIESWPQGFFVDWLLDGLYVPVALFLGALPGVLVSQVMLCAGGGVWLYGVAFVVGCTCALLVLFPVLLLSMLEAGSPFNPISRPVWRSLSVARNPWVQFYTRSVVLAVAGLAILLGFGRGGIVGNFLVLFVVTVLSVIYFRLLGRLAWCCREAVAESSPPQPALQEPAS